MFVKNLQLAGQSSHSHCDIVVIIVPRSHIRSLGAWGRRKIPFASSLFWFHERDGDIFKSLSTDHLHLTDRGRGLV